MTIFRRIRAKVKREWDYVKDYLSHKDENYRLALRQGQRVTCHLQCALAWQQ